MLLIKNQFNHKEREGGFLAKMKFFEYTKDGVNV